MVVFHKLCRKAWSFRVNKTESVKVMVHAWPAAVCSMGSDQRKRSFFDRISSFWSAVLLDCHVLSTWQMTAASCPTALDALCGQPMSRLVSYHERSAAMATERLQPLDLACGTLFQYSCAIQTSPTDCLDDS